MPKKGLEKDCFQSGISLHFQAFVIHYGFSTKFIKQFFLWIAWNSKTVFTGSKFEEVNIGSILLKWMNFDGRDDDRAGKQKQCSAENLPIFLASFVKVSIFLIILSRHHLLRRLSALHHGALRLYKVSFGFSYIYN